MCYFMCTSLFFGVRVLFWVLQEEKMSHLSTRFTPMKPRRGPRFPSRSARVRVRLPCSCCRAPGGPRRSPVRPRLTAQGSQTLLHLFSFLLRPRFHSPPLSWSPSVSRFVFTPHRGWCQATISGVSPGPCVRNFSSFGV